MRRRAYKTSLLWDRTVWIGRFTGYRLLAWGKEQVLDAQIEIQVHQVTTNPAVWHARAYPGAAADCASGSTAEACMAAAAELFTQCLVPWAAFTPTIHGTVEHKRPQLVKPSERKAG